MDAQLIAPKLRILKVVKMDLQLIRGLVINQWLITEPKFVDAQNEKMKYFIN